MRRRQHPDLERRSWRRKEQDAGGLNDAEKGNAGEERGLRRCAGNFAEEEAKELLADEMLHRAYLRSNPNEDTIPRAYSELQLARKSRGRCVTRLIATTGDLVDVRPSEDAESALKFLISVTPLTKREKFFLRGWMLGWTQRESIRRWKAIYGEDGESVISQVLKGAIDRCTDSSIVTFTAFSRHVIYRKPTRRYYGGNIRCAYCKELYSVGAGDGRYCSTACRFASIHPE